MIIANSLGANYSDEDIRLSLALLFQPWRWKNGKETGLFEQALLVKFRKLHAGSLRNLNRNLNIRLFHKGRQAIGEALRILKIGSGDKVIVQAFTCVAVVRPILEAGAMPVYVDVAPKSLNPPLSSIKQRVTARTRAVILQHTLGVVNPENEEIVSWCRQKGIAVIQDLAHALGALEFEKAWPSGGRPGLNKNPDAMILSFSQDKVVDGVSGGGLVTLNQSTVPNQRLNDLNHLTFGAANSATIFKNLLYPVCTWMIRSSYQYGIGDFTTGKGIHWLAKLIGLLNSPIEASAKPLAMPNAMTALVLNQFRRLDKISNHRRQIGLLYNEALNSKLKIVSKDEILAGANLRYPIWVNNRNELEEKLKGHGFYLVDHWYDAAVSPEWVDPEEVKYKPGSCPNAEELSKHIFNLPTHVNISRSKAEELAVLINKYAESQ